MKTLGLPQLAPSSVSRSETLDSSTLTDQVTVADYLSAPLCHGLQEEPWLSLAEATDGDMEGVSPAQYPVIPSCPLRTGSFVIARTGSRVVIGEVLALYVKSSEQHGWHPEVQTKNSLSYLSFQVFVQVGIHSL